MAGIPRVTEDFLRTWNDYVQHMPAAPLFREWGGIFLISAALSRRCWMITDPTFPALYPNLFVLLVGPPGSGKDMVVNKVVELITAAHAEMAQGGGFRLAERSISPKGIVDLMAEEESEFSFRLGRWTVTKVHSVLACVPELGTMLPVYNTQMISFLNELYNCSPLFEEQTRGRGSSSVVRISNPHLAMLLGTQPTTLAETFPEQAFRMGFFSRTTLVHSREEVIAKPYDRARPNREELLPNLISDLRAMATVCGVFKTTPAFEAAINEFAATNPKRLEHSRFSDYNTRRWLHLHKLSAICSASEGNSLRIDVPHFIRAQDILLRAEKSATTVFDNLVTSAGFQHTVEQVVASRTGDIITHQELERQLRRTHRPFEVGQIIRSMLGAGDLVPMDVPEDQMPKYRISREVKEKLG